MAIVATAQQPVRKRVTRSAASASFFWLTAFYVVYCMRPEDWVPGLGSVPLAKIAAVGAFFAFVLRSGSKKRTLRDLPAESYYLLALIGVLMLSAVLSPVWKGGALFVTLNFAKVYIVWVLTYLLVTNFSELRRIIFIQAIALPVVCTISIVKGHSHERLNGVLGGIYTNPNDLAFAIVLSLPFCFVFLLTARGVLRKLLWTAGMLVMGVALVLTASRGGFVTLLVAGVVCLWHFGVKGRRFYLIAASGIVLLLLLGVLGGPLRERFGSIFSDEADSKQVAIARGSFESRKFLMERAIDGIIHYPILGLGAQNFETYSTVWREVHMTYLQIAVEGGIPSLILYLMFFARGFRNLRQLLRRKNLDSDIRLFTGALHASLVGFGFGALFSPEAYQFFPYFSVAYTSALLALVVKGEESALPDKSPNRQARHGRLLHPTRVPVNT
jgi:O-antigen ligase